MTQNCQNPTCSEKYVPKYEIEALSKAMLSDHDKIAMQLACFSTTVRITLSCAGKYNGVCIQNLMHVLDECISAYIDAKGIATAQYRKAEQALLDAGVTAHILHSLPP